MHSVFTPQTAAALADRIANLSPDAQAQWGQMSPWQMVQHCISSEQMYQGVAAYPRLFIGRLFGRMALKGILKDAAPMQHNQPTHPAFKIQGQGDLFLAKQAWQALISAYPAMQPKDFDQFVHPFFGKMTYAQIGRYVYKHTDHHLRQFGA